jgi:chemotaxis protein MotB
MSKKKHAEHVNHERWLVSYADFITLLFAFFVVLFASGQNDKRKTIKLAEAMQSAFQYNGIFDQHAKTPPLSDDPATAPAAVPSPLMLPVPAAVDAEKLAVSNTTVKDQIQDQIQGQIQGQAQAKSEIETLIHDQVALKQITSIAVAVHESDQGLVVSLREAGFFNSGSAEVRPQALEVLHQIAALLPHQPMRIEGHTDDMPIHTAQFATNWELSTARAANVTRLLLAQRAVDPTQVSAAGYAEFQPVASNATDAGRQLNRRVDIILLKPHAAEPQASPDPARSAPPPTAAATAKTAPAASK